MQSIRASSSIRFPVPPKHRQPSGESPTNEEEFEIDPDFDLVPIDDLRRQGETGAIEIIDLID